MPRQRLSRAIDGLQDRIETLGGHLEIVSPPGNGAALVARIPFDAV
ncbi:hypothetical protein [Dactylosporangium fulvum]|uniref:Sensor histidine kinase n=1 Tax=Dactylosporangium fulvum TaxID=53359 RepID=A0ABY5VMN9_9ACTN|nr:hypothetical protein [Dactylosporangium fulvum]UWP78967.1 hypothetical protein Dfulv_27780 [Dactylosporangium fulvum]